MGVQRPRSAPPNFILLVAIINVRFGLEAAIVIVLDPNQSPIKATPAFKSERLGE